MTAPGPPPLNPGDPRPLLVPLLSTEDGPPDSAAVAAWQLALSNLIGVEVPHDLLGLWLFPTRGGVVLLAPAELGQDRITLPLPSPFLHQHELYDLEERIRHAGYRSAIAVPVRGSERDLGLALFANLDPGSYGVVQALRLDGLVRDLVPTFQALSAAPPLAVSTGTMPAVTPGNLSEVVARAAAEARTGPELLRLVSGVIQPMLPHERLEVALTGARPGRWALLSGAPPGARWGGGEAGPGDQPGGAVEALLARAQADGTLLVQDLKAAGLVWPGHAGWVGRGAQRVRAVLGAELRLAEALPAWLLVGGAAPNSFRPADRETIARVAPVVALRVHGLRQSLATEVGQAQLHALQSAQPKAARLVALLSTTQHWGDATRQFERAVLETLGYRAVQFTLRLGEDRVVTFHPGELRPLGDLLPEPLELSAVAAVLQGTAPFVVHGEGGSTLAVPLRIGGRPVGAMELLEGESGPAHPVTAAQQFADVIAPHLELLRRSALAGREARSGERASRPSLRTES